MVGIFTHDLSSLPTDWLADPVRSRLIRGLLVAVSVVLLLARAPIQATAAPHAFEARGCPGSFGLCSRRRAENRVLRAAVREVSVALAQGALTELPVHRFPLAEVAAAHEAVESGVTGKVVLQIE